MEESGEPGKRAFIARSGAAAPGAAGAAFPLRLGDGTVVPAERRRDDTTAFRLFEDVPREAVERALARCPVIVVERETEILRPGAPNTSIYLLLSGRVAVYLDERNSGNVVNIEPGSCLGELSMIDGRLATAYAIAAPGAQLLRIDQEVFWSELAPQPAVVRNMLRLMTQRMRVNHDRVLHGLRKQLELEIVQKELRVAREIQAGMLPASFPRPDGDFPVDVFALMEPAKDVGGDLYDVFRSERGALYFSIGDVSGKGVPAALFMARTMDMVRVVSRLLRAGGAEDIGPAEILMHVNDELCQNNASLMFVTLLVGRLDARSGDLVYCSAGHPAPMRLASSEGPFELPCVRAAPLGLTPGRTYRDQSVLLARGETLFAYSDGISEAENRDYECFGEERLADALRGCRGVDARSLIAGVIEAVRQYAAGTPPSDDITAIAIRRL
jgi:sigma-B regulation protein RsbU (phosphoserine phosphatase)